MGENRSHLLGNPVSILFECEKQSSARSVGEGVRHV